MEFFLARAYIFYDIKYRLIEKLGGVIFMALYYCPVFSRKVRINFLLASHRASYGKFSAKEIKKNIAEVSKAIEPVTHSTEKIKKEIIGRSIVLKKTLEVNGEIVEKGIMLIKFSETFSLYLRHVECEKLMEKFHVILEPSWTGHAIEQILGWCKFDAKVYIQCADKPDFDFITSLHSNLVPLRMGSGEFVDYRIFQPLTNEKKYDLVCVANGLVYKRVYAFLRLIKKLKRDNSGVRAALVCANRGPLLQTIEKLIHVMGLDGSVDYFTEVSQLDLNKIIEQSKINILMSYREGSNRVLFEAIFSGTPSVVIDRNIGIRKECFTQDSGMVAREAFLAKDISFLLMNVAQMKPREWALKNISPEVSVDKLVNLIAVTEYGGDRFQSQIYYKVNSPEATYMHLYTDMSKKISDDLLACYLR